MTAEQEAIEGEAVALVEVVRSLEELLGEWSPEQRAQGAACLGGFLFLVLRRRAKLGVRWRDEQRDLLIQAVQRRTRLDAPKGGE